MYDINYYYSYMVLLSLNRYYCYFDWRDDYQDESSIVCFEEDGVNCFSTRSCNIYDTSYNKRLFVGLDDINQLSDRIILYPNPTQNELNIESPYEIERITISDIIGVTKKSLKVKGNKIVGRGHNTVVASKDPTAHAEINAIKKASKYIGDWGGESTTYKFEAIKDGEVVKTIIKAPMTEAKLKVNADHTSLVEKNSYDVALVRIEAVDNYGNRLPFYNDPVVLEAKGSIELIGPGVVALSGGMFGAYVKTKGRKGKGSLTIKMGNGYEEKVEFDTVIVK